MKKGTKSLVFDKIAKLSHKEFNLSSDVVELANVKDLDKARKEGDKEHALAKKNIEQAMKFIAEAKTAYRQSAMAYNRGASTYEDLLKGAKDLGIDLPQDIKAKADKMAEFTKEAQNNIKKLQSAEGNLK